MVKGLLLESLLLKKILSFKNLIININPISFTLS